MEGMELKNLFGNIYRSKKVLITGNTGFKGSWLSLWLQGMGAEVLGFSLDKVSKPSHFSLLGLKHKTVFGDICDKKKIESAMQAFKPDIVFHLAAQSLVIESYKDPRKTYLTNVIGTFNVLEAADRCVSVKAVVNVTTDKVYENSEIGLSFKEGDKLGGRDMYSSSKACSDILTSSYRQSILGSRKLLFATARAGNVIGGGDWAKDRLIPDLIRAISENKNADIRYPEAIRPWEHVLEPLSGYLLLGQHLLEGKSHFACAWNFGPKEKSCITVKDVLMKMSKSWDEINYKADSKRIQFHEAGILKLDCTKAERELGWSPVWDLDETIRKTILWYRNYLVNKIINSAEDLEDYVNSAVNGNKCWVN